MEGMVTTESEAGRKRRWSWRVYVWLGLLACVGIEFVLMRVYRSVRFRFFHDPAFEYAPIAAAMIHRRIWMIWFLLTSRRFLEPAFRDFLPLDTSQLLLLSNRMGSGS